MNGPGTRGPSLRAAGVLVWVLVAMVAAAMLIGTAPFGSHYTLNAVLREANNVKSGTPVRIAGIDVGRVTSVSPAGGSSAGARVTMTVDRKGLPIHADASLRVRQRNFLEGYVFIELEPGSPSARILHSGDTVPVRQTSASVQYDQILSNLQADPRSSLQGLLKELSRGLEGDGAAGYNRSIPYWAPAYRESAVAAQAFLGLRTHDLSSYLRGAGRTAAAFDRDPAALRALISGFKDTAEGLARNDWQLTAAITQLPHTLDTGRRALRDLNVSLPPFRRLVATMRPAIRSAAPALSSALPLVQELHGVVQPTELRGLAGELARATPPLARLSRRGVPLFEQVRLASSCQEQTLLPFSRMTIQDPAFPAAGRVFEEGPKVLPGLVGQWRRSDANGEIGRTLLQSARYATPTRAGRFLLTTNPIAGLNPPPPRSWPQFRPDVPCETQEPPDLRSSPSRVPNQRTVHATNRRLLEHYRDLAVEGLGRQGGPQAKQAADLLKTLLGTGGGPLKLGDTR